MQLILFIFLKLLTSAAISQETKPLVQEPKPMERDFFTGRLIIDNSDFVPSERKTLRMKFSQIKQVQENNRGVDSILGTDVHYIKRESSSISGKMTYGEIVGGYGFGTSGITGNDSLTTANLNYRFLKLRELHDSEFDVPFISGDTFVMDAEVVIGANFRDERLPKSNDSAFGVMDIGFKYGSLERSESKKENSNVHDYTFIGACGDLRANFLESEGIEVDLYVGGMAKFSCSIGDNVEHAIEGEVSFMEGVTLDRDYFDAKLSYIYDRYDICAGYTNDSIKYNQLDGEEILYISMGIVFGRKCH